MAWVEGTNAELEIIDYNEEILKLKGELEEERTREMLGRFLRYNLGITVWNLTGFILESYQRIIIKGWLQKNFILCVAGRSFSKSFLASHFAYLYCLFNREHHVLMVSATFRSSRRVLENIETWANRKPRDGADGRNPGGVLLADTIDKVSKKPDMYTIRFKNGSTITAVPLGDPDNLRGFRCNVLIIDEGLLIPQSTIDLVLKPFLAGGSDITKKQKIRKKESVRIAAGTMKEEERAIFKSTSKMLILSSASYRWEELYQTYQKYLKIIDPDPNAPEGTPAREQMEGGNVSSYLVQQLSYKVAREELMDPAIVKEIKEKLIPEGVIKREYEAQFIDESGGYFSAKEMMQCTVPGGQLPCIEITGESGAEYILGIDPNVAASDSADHFAMCVIKIIKRASDGRRMGLVVHQYGCCGVKLEHHIAYLYYLLVRFKPVYVVCDTTQGDAGDFISVCNESEYFKTRSLELNPIQANFTSDSFEGIVKDVRRSYNPDSAVRRIVQKQPFTSAIIKSGNEYMRACFDQKLLLFASHAQSVPNMVPAMCEQDVMSVHRTHPEYTDDIGQGNMYEFVTYQDNMIEVVKKECALIEMVASPTGNVTFDLPHSMTRNRKNILRQRRDNYCALWLCNWGLKIYLAMSEMLIQEEDDMPAPRWI